MSDGFDVVELKELVVVLDDDREDELYGMAGPCCWNILDLDAALSRLGLTLDSTGSGEGGRRLSKAGVTSCTSTLSVSSSRSLAKLVLLVEAVVNVG